MKRILINATHAEEIRVALCNGNHLYDFDLENRTREQKKANIYKARVTRVEPSLEAVFVEYGAERQGFLPIREIANEYLSADPRSTNNIKQLIKEGDELIVQVEKEERGNKGAALSTFISLAGRYLVLMPNNPRGGGISRQISGKLREEMKQALSDLQLPKGMSVIIRTAGIGKTTEDLQHDLDHLLTIWKGIQQQNQKYPAPRLMHQEAGVVTRAVRDYLRDDIAEIWVDNANAYNEAANFIEAVMPQQLSKLRKYSDYEPMFARFGIEKQIETAYQREVRLPSGGSIVIDQTEALVSIDINSSKATKGADVSETAFNTNLEAADEIARQLRLRDMGGLIVIDFIDMATEEHQKQVENRIKEATKNDRARIQFAEISRFGLLEMSRQRLRPSLEEATGYLCPRCHGTGMIRDLRSLSLSIMRQIEQKALLERQGEVQADVPTEIAAFLLNEKRDSLVYLEQESGTRITILPHAHLESPDFSLTYNREGFAPSSYERVTESEQQENKDRGYDTTNWHTDDNEVNRIARPSTPEKTQANTQNNQNTQNTTHTTKTENIPTSPNPSAVQPQPTTQTAPQSSAVAWLSNLFAPTQQAQVTHTVSSQDAAAAIESIVNTGAKSLGVQGQLAYPTLPSTPTVYPTQDTNNEEQTEERREKRNNRRPKNKKSRSNDIETTLDHTSENNKSVEKLSKQTQDKTDTLPKREPNSRRESRGEKQRHATLSNDKVTDTTTDDFAQKSSQQLSESKTTNPSVSKSEEHSANKLPRHEKLEKAEAIENTDKPEQTLEADKTKQANPAQVQVQVHKAPVTNNPTEEAIHLSLDNSKAPKKSPSIEPAKLEPVELVQPIVEELKSSDDLVAKETQIQETQAKEPQAAPVAIVSENTQNITNDQTTLQTDKPSLEVTPTQGRAKNDPREVYRAFSQRFGTTDVHTQTTMPLAKITGTVQQFIEQQLGEIDHNNVVTNFIKAVERFNQNSHPATAVTQTVTQLDNSEQQQTFEAFFRNYGYQNLSHDNLMDYHQMITPANQFHVQAGKTHALPAVVTQRASNDPRGQIVLTDSHPTKDKNEGVDNSFEQAMQNEIQAFKHATDKATQKSAQQIEKDLTQELTNLSEQMHQSTESVSHAYARGSVGAWIVEKLGEQGLNMIQQGQLVNAYLLASEPTANHEKTNHPTTKDKKTSKPAEKTELPEEGKLVKMKLAKPAKIEASEAMDNEQTEQSINSAAKGKTTPTSYKNMIESVAEQLIPSAGSVLNLPLPKAPKARTRKAKTTEKAPAKPKTRTSKKVDNVVIVKKPKVETQEVTDTSDHTPQE